MDHAVGARRTLVAALAGLGVVTVYVLVAMTRLRGVDYDLWGAVLVVPLLLAATVPLARRAAAREDDPALFRILMLATVVTLAVALVRYGVAFGIYDGVADAAAYAGEGTSLANTVHAGKPDLAVPGPIPGTGTISVVVGLLFSVIGTTTLGGFMVFGWLALGGRWLFYRAFRTALPEHDARRYLLFVLFFPSMVFWPSSLGKEAWMLLALGLSTLGIARVLRQRRRGYLLLAAGSGMAFLVRPHLVLLVVPALAVGLLLRRPDIRDKLMPLRQVATVVLVLVLGIAAVGVSADFFGVEASLAAMGDLLEDTEVHTAQGGSSFQPRPVTGPADVPAAAITVLFRPFPHEAGSSQELLTALESAVLLALAVRYTPTALASLRDRRSWPMIAVAVIYILLFVVAFSRFGNFGLLARQRVQVLPFLFMLLALRPVGARDRTS